ncbi:dipeptidase [Virgibacillus halodenitrificans]|uniref:dipeptidase n=1 Tax=Virgibacillus halodenitrificans TaxID=1482 RepID=UPI001F21A39F|nr:dipeptidase [Virgibacillus halodenitrificans]MCG1027224.1 dipeptidase [Virgibacillus halodenitrificans]
MNVIDTHCDALVKMQIAKRERNQLVSYKNSEQLTTNLMELQKGKVIVQFFAIFIKPYVPTERKWEYALEQIEIFHSEIIGKNPSMKHIKHWQDIDKLREGEIGAILTLEGAEPIGNELEKLEYLYRAGILLIGLTWNHANLCGDGAGVPNAGGLTSFGKEVIKHNNKHGVFTDVSHASVNGFWDTVEIADYLIASHSNVRSLCDHPRNLNDDQIKSMLDNNGLIHVVYNPPFIHKKNVVKISDLIKHIDYICALDGVKNIGFGSDFDGIKTFVSNLERASHYQNLINELLKYYSEDEVKGFAYQNFLHNRPRNFHTTMSD